MSLREEVQSIAITRKVPFLVHFTRADNVPSILNHGLVPIEVAKKAGLNPVINDHKRLDGRLNGTSLSIAFPNGKMFFRLRNEDPTVDWVVLAIAPSVLWSKDVLFCSHNAADIRVSKVDSDRLRQVDSFHGMFVEIEGELSRAEQGIKDCDPTDVQAEVLVLEIIEPQFIIGALCNDVATKNRVRPYFGKRKLIVHEGKKGVFANRTYYRKFGGG